MFDEKWDKNARYLVGELLSTPDVRKLSPEQRSRLRQKAIKLATEDMDGPMLMAAGNIGGAIAPLMRQIREMIEYAVYGPEPDWMHEYLHAWEDAA